MVLLHQKMLGLLVLRDGKVLVRAGEPSDALYTVINGRLRVVLERGDGAESMLHELHRGRQLAGRLACERFDQLLATYTQAMIRQSAAPMARR